MALPSSSLAAAEGPQTMDDGPPQVDRSSLFLNSSHQVRPIQGGQTVAIWAADKHKYTQIKAPTVGTAQPV